MKRSLTSFFRFSFWISFSLLCVAALTFSGFTSFFSRQPQAGEKPLFYSTELKDGLQNEIVTAIQQAKHSVLLMIYSLRDKKVLSALRDRSENGVEVTIICDAEASKEILPYVGEKTRVYFQKGEGLMHQKILVVDNRQVWIGSANMTYTSLKMHSNLVVAVDHPPLAKAIQEKAAMMTNEGLIEDFPKHTFSLGGQRAELWFQPDFKPGVEEITRLIQRAKKRIRVAMFTWTRRDFVEELIAAKKRGVDVQVAVDRSSSTGASRHAVKQLMDGGIPVRVNQGPWLLHHKCMVVDDAILVNGSANWTLSAFSKNDESVLILHDLTTEQVNYLRRLWDAIVEESILKEVE